MRDSRLFIEEMLQAIRRIAEYTSGLRFGEFLEDAKTFDAVVRCLAIVGEAAKGTSHEVRAKYSEVEWKQAAGMRDRVVHDYFGIDPVIVWDVVTNHLPDFERKLARVLDSLESDPTT